MPLKCNIYTTPAWLYFVGYRADSRFAPSQWETALLCNDVSHWLGTNLESALGISLFCALVNWQSRPGQRCMGVLCGFIDMAGQSNLHGNWNGHPRAAPIKHCWGQWGTDRKSHHHPSPAQEDVRLEAETIIPNQWDHIHAGAGWL